MRHLIPTLIFALVLSAAWSVLAQPAPTPEPAAEVAPPSTDPVPGPAEATAEATAEPADAAGDDNSAAPAVEDVIGAIPGVIQTWRTAGWLAGMMALINLIMLALRVGQVNALLTSIGAKWLKPLLACLLGALFGGLSAAAGGSPAWVAIVAGVLAGLSSVGLHQLLDQIATRGKTA